MSNGHCPSTGITISRSREDTHIANRKYEDNTRITTYLKKCKEILLNNYFIVVIYHI